MGAVGLEERTRFGHMPEERGLYPKMKVGEQLTCSAELSGMSGTAAKAAAESPNSPRIGRRVRLEEAWRGGEA
jgi:ABC-2 type transport system ATP-binding protein